MTLECLAKGHPLPATRWTLNGSDLSPSDRVAIRPGYVLLVDVDATMEGDYGCVAWSTAAGVNFTAAVDVATVRIMTPPQFIRRPKSQVFPTAKTVRFECEIAGYPAPDVRWFKVIRSGFNFFNGIEIEC